MLNNGRFSGTYTNKKITLLRTFTEDQRISMDIYADQLRLGLEKRLSNQETINDFIPEMPAWAKRERSMDMRISRYVSYPAQVLKQKSDLFHIIDHGYGHLVHFANPKKCLITVHDLIPLLRWKNRIKGADSGRIPLLTLLSMISLKRADHLIAVSNSTKKDLMELLGIQPDQISVIYSGIDPIFHPYTFEERKRVREKLWGPKDTNFRILISGNEFYKNYQTSIRVLIDLLTLGYSNVRLVKMGLVNPEWEDLIRRNKLENFVTTVGYLPREAIPDIYNAIDLLFFPSLYEGFGWPPLEAMACGTPVITSNAASLPEVVGEAGILLDPLNKNGYVEEIIKLILDRRSYDSYIRAGLKRAKLFSWESTIAKTLSVYDRLVHRATMTNIR